MRNSIYHTALLTMLLAASCIAAGGCGGFNNRPPEEALNLALAGIAGSDSVTFDGSAALLREGETTPALNQTYGGKMENHNQLSLYTLLPSQGVSTPAAASLKKPAEKGKTRQLSGSRTAYSKLEKKGGQWRVRSADLAEGKGSALTRLNPLLQLEELGKAAKTVKEETGAASGTQVLRIELTREAARRLLSKELEGEMAALRPASGTVKAGGTALSRKADKDIEALWERKNSELQTKLSKADVTAVYHLTVDKKRNLPTKLDWTRTISYDGGQRQGNSERLIVQVQFHDYH